MDVRRIDKPPDGIAIRAGRRAEPEPSLEHDRFTITSSRNAENAPERGFSANAAISAVKATILPACSKHR